MKYDYTVEFEEKVTFLYNWLTSIFDEKNIVYHYDDYTIQMKSTPIHRKFIIGCKKLKVIVGITHINEIFYGGALELIDFLYAETNVEKATEIND